MNILMAHSGLMDSAVYTASSEATDYEVERAADIQPSKKWRTTGKTAEYVVIDLGAVSTFDFVGLLHTNIVNDATSTIRIRTADTEGNLTAAPTYDSTATRAIPSGAQGDYNYNNILFQIPADKTNRWIRIDLVATANGDAYIEIGRVYVSKAFIPDTNISYGWSMGIEDLTKPTQALGGPSYPNPKPKSRVLRCSLDFNDEDTMYDSAFAIDRTIGASKDIFIHRDADNLDRYMDYAVYGLQQSVQPVVNPAYNLFSKRYTIKELL
jgi:hypothetical protein